MNRSDLAISAIKKLLKGRVIGASSDRMTKQNEMIEQIRGTKKKKKKKQQYSYVHPIRDACCLTMERGLGLILYELMSINLIRFLASQKKKAQRYHTDKLRYRGVVYKEID